MTQVLISIGSNQNNPQRQIKTAFESIRSNYAEAQMSSLFLTQPVGGVSQEAFVNASIKFKTDSSAESLLAYLMSLEQKARRNRQEEIPNGPRNLDLDIILFGQSVSSDATLSIPHPRFRERRFVLVPSAEIAGEMRDPVSGESIDQLLKNCTDTYWVRSLDEEMIDA